MKAGVIFILGALMLGPLMPSAAADAGVLSELSVDFELLNANGERVTLDDYRGRHVLLAFGFTHCHHICPMIAANMARSLNARSLNDNAKEAVGIFISVDTERDTPEITQAYASGFGDKMVGLGGSYAQISAAARNFGVTFVVTKSEDNYTVQHTPSIFLIAPDGKLLEVFAMNAPVKDIVAAMQ